MAWFSHKSSPVSAGIRAPRVRTSHMPLRRADRAGESSARWPWLAMLLGALAALVVWAPAGWLAAAVTQASGERVVLADAQGTVWDGSVVAVLTGGPGSRDARALPGRLGWSLRPMLAGGPGLRMTLRQPCCLDGVLQLAIRPGWQTLTVAVQPSQEGTTPWARWPAAVLTGLGTPWNTLQPGGAVRLASRALELHWAQGRFSLQGEAVLELADFSSRLATLPSLGTYQARVAADPAQTGTAQVSLTTTEGALRLSGNGTWSAGGLRLRGEASAAQPQDEITLNNLLNIIGRRQGARSLISIG